MYTFKLLLFKEFERDLSSNLVTIMAGYFKNILNWVKTDFKMLLIFYPRFLSDFILYQLEYL